MNTLYFLETLWYEFTAGETGSYEINVNFDDCCFIAVYDSDNVMVYNITGIELGAFLNMEADETYFIQIGAWVNFASFSFTVFLANA